MPRPSFDPATDYYSVLGLASGASVGEIQAAYRRLAKAYHPDLNAGSARAAARMARVNAAKSVLLDISVRAAYDAERRARLARTSAASAIAVAATRPRSGPRPVPSPAPKHAVPRPRRADPAVAARGWFDRQTVVILAVVVPLLFGGLVYLLDAAQIAAKPVTRSVNDFALVPNTRPSPEGTARAVYALVGGRLPNDRVGYEAYRLTSNPLDGSPEAELLRSLGRRLYRAGVNEDRVAWNQAAAELCVLAGRC